MKYVFIDTDNGGTPTNATPDTSTSKYHTTSSWPANGARWNSLSSAFSDSDIRGITDDLTIYCRGSAADTAVATGTALTCATLVIEGDVTSAAWDTSKYRIVHTGANGNGLNLTGTGIAGSITIRKLQIELNGSASSVTCCYIGGNGNSVTNTVDSCIFRMGSTARSNATGNAIGVLYDSSGTSTTLKILNTIIYGIGGTGGSNLSFGVRCNTSNACTAQFYNTVIYSITTGGSVARGISVNSADTTTAKNCAVFSTGSADLFTIDTVNYCATDDTYSGTGNVTGLTWANQFQDHVNGDFRLKSGSSLIGAGIGPSSDANVPSTDIAGVTRSGTTTDIGAAMFVSAGASLTSVDTDNAVLASQSQATFAGTGLASTAKFAVKRGSAIAYATDISLSGSTGGSFTAPTMTAMFSAGVRFGDVAFYAAETSGTAIASISGSITTATNWKYVNVTDLSATGSMGSLFYNNAVSLSDQVAYSSVTTRFRWPVTVSGDGYFTVNSSGSQAGDEFAYRIWDETDSTWGTEGTIEVNGGISSAEQVYAAGSLVQVSLESSTLEGATLQ